MPNIALAEMLCQDQNHAAIAVVVEILQSGSKPHQQDAIKVIYEVGSRCPDLIEPYTDVFFNTLSNKNNRIVWGTLMALAQTCKMSPERVADRLDVILEAADNGSVIAKDQAIEILICLRSLPHYSQKATEELFNRLAVAAINQLPKYAEMTIADLKPDEASQFLSILEARQGDDMPESKRKRLLKAMTKAKGMMD